MKSPSPRICDQFSRARSSLFIALGLGLVMLSNGCVSLGGQFAPSVLGRAYAPRTEPAKIEIFRSQIPTKSFIEIGAVNACCSDSVDRMVEMLRRKASENGGDALTALDIGAKGGASATVIRFE